MDAVVVNVKTNDYDVYIGDANPFLGEKKSIFANPFPIKFGRGRKKAIELYRKWFYDKINSSHGFKARVEKLRGKRLGCWCTPKPCHGDVIVEYLKGE